MTKPNTESPNARPDLDDGVSVPQPTLARIRSRLASLAPSDRRVAEVVVADPYVVLRSSITEVAERAGTSESTVIRASKRLGFDGFQSLKLALALEANPVPPTALPQVTSGAEPIDVLSLVLQTSSQVLSDAATTIDPRAFAAAVDILINARSVLVVGVGPSAPIVSDCVYRLRTIGLDCASHEDIIAQHLAAASLTEADVLVAISHTGATPETLKCVQAAAKTGVTTIAITSFAASPLTGLVDHVLVAGASRISHRVDADASRFAHLGVVDGLLVAVALRTEGRSDRAAAIHQEVLSQHQL